MRCCTTCICQILRIFTSLQAGRRALDRTLLSCIASTSRSGVDLTFSYRSQRNPYPLPRAYWRGHRKHATRSSLRLAAGSANGVDL